MPRNSRTIFFLLYFMFTCALLARADMTVLIPGGSRTIMVADTDTLVTGERIRSNFEKVYWFPAASQDEGFLFMHHELSSPDGGLTRLSYLNGDILEIEDWVVGTHKNCSGNVSSWGTILSCEEFPPDSLPDVGYIVEVDPEVADAWIRRIAMGRFSHESIIEDPLTGDLYLTDDQNDGVFFKFIADSPGDLSSGSLYALREPTQDWVLLTDMVNTRDEALALGATARPRPEGLVYNATDDKIYIAVTGRENSGDSGFGYLLRFDPRTNLMERWLDGGLSTFANPDNIEVDTLGNLLVQEDKYDNNVDSTGPNRLILVRPDATTMVVMVGLDVRGEVTGLEWGGSDDRFFLVWHAGQFPDRQQLMEVHLPSGWNALPADVPVEPHGSPNWASLVVAPNPFSSTTRIHASLPTEEGATHLGIYRADGSLVRRLRQDGRGTGEIDVSWDGRDEHGLDVGPGVYFVRARVGLRVVTEGVVRIR